LKATAVIGSNFGDEGKGLMTDFFSERDNLVIRYNGGAQAGHTVETPEGQRHIFSHFGAGTMRGAWTYLSRHFVCNPIVFVRELMELERLEIDPKIVVDPRCLITTPYDIMLNRFAEESRGDHRHGSVGVGFGETIERSQHFAFRLTVDELYALEISRIRSRLDLIRDLWVPRRIKQLGLRLTKEQIDLVNDTGITDTFLDDLCTFWTNTTRSKPNALKGFEKIVFEGAQGLMLDQDYGLFPHVTRSSTGLLNICDLVQDFGITELDAVYVTRSYLTRHGAGPLIGEKESTRFPHLVDPTNIPNDWQGAMRFAPLIPANTAFFIARDLRVAHHLTVTPHLAMSCCDQIDGAKAQANFKEMADALQIREGYMSFGPTRNTIKEVVNV
jgi:adenylosuccinate synthase